jgi:hypothetical protein
LICFELEALIAAAARKVAALEAELVELYRKEEAAIEDCRRTGRLIGDDFWLRRHRAEARLRAARALLASLEAEAGVIDG